MIIVSSGVLRVSISFDEFLLSRKNPVCIISSNALPEYFFNFNVRMVIIILVERFKREQLVFIWKEGGKMLLRIKY